MRKIETPIGTMLHPGTKEEASATEKLLANRHAFVAEYCRKSGWSEDPGELSIEQIIEIRKQEGWIKA